MAETFTWRTASPESQGFAGAKLEAMRQGLAARQTKAVLVVRNDRIVLEWYAPDHGPEKPHYTASLAKALVGGLSLMLALNDGRIGVDAPAWKYIPAWKNDPAKSKITIRQLATHTSGIADADEGGKPHEQLTGWKGDFWKRRPDPFTIALHQAPVVFEPGSAYAYSNPGTAALAYCITAGLRNAPEKDIRTLLKKRVMDPIGIPEREWSVGYGQTYMVDGLPLVATWGGGSYTARTVARVGRLMLRKGDWDGRQLVEARWVEKVTAYQDMPDPPRPGGQPNPGSGLCWWTNTDQVWTTLPRDAFAGAGAGNQLLLVVPSLRLIVVRNGELIGDEKMEGFWGGTDKHLFKPLMEAVVEKPTRTSAPADLTGKAPYPPSPVITGVTWAPLATVRRDARGSDNWPITWGDDDALYTAYGDGNGFAAPKAPRLSLGLAKVLGGAEDFKGANIRSETGEQKGDGASGKKASGMLMVDGVLYMLARNAKNAQLAWSADRGQTWTWADWRFTTSFGYPTFLNFGKDYAGARDDFVYVYSHDRDSAYENADRMVLARVPKARLRERDAYEFFVKQDVQGQAVWTKDIAARGAVFEHTGRCYRSGISYCAPLKRYLWVQIIPGGDTRFKGGFGIYDAPAPWGPWTTVFFTEKWDMGPGETASFPTRWMSADGRTLHLVSSTTDHFTVRRATLTLAGPAPDAASM